MSVAPELVTVTVDDVPVQVPKGIGLVEAALYAGIEIPVFCYEPRLGPPVGACRMCLCEVAPGPKERVWSWRGHSPPLSQTGQSSGWLMSRNSSVAFWASAAFSLESAVRTTIPSCAVIVQAVCIFGMPSTSHRHMRQAPTGGPSRGS